MILESTGDDMLELALRALPERLDLNGDLQTALPRLAKSRRAMEALRSALHELPVEHRLYVRDARELEVPDESVHLVLTSPPYWTLKEYRDTDGQLGHIADYEAFLSELDKVWRRCHRALVPGGRLIIVVGDVCISRKKSGRHYVMPLHASIQEHCRGIGYDNLAPIIWYKISNATLEVENGSSFLGKPYEPNAVIKNDIEYVLMQRKPGGYRSPSIGARILSLIPEEDHRSWFRQIWDLPGASTQHHPAPFPLELATRLIRMFSFVGDTVLDPFMGTGTTNLAAVLSGRSSIGCEIDPVYFASAVERLNERATGLFTASSVIVER